MANLDDFARSMAVNIASLVVEPPFENFWLRACIQNVNCVWTDIGLLRL